MYEMVSKEGKRKEPAVKMVNRTGIPDGMKARYEQRSGFSFDDVRVQYHSDKPAQLQAFAYTQGNRVYVGPGQEKHLEHELGHVVQQKQGRVGITSFLKGVGLNEDPAMEREADSYARNGGGGMGVPGGARPAGPGAPVQLRRWRWVQEDENWEPVELDEGEVESDEPYRAGKSAGEILDTSSAAYLIETAKATMNRHGANQSETLHSTSTTQDVTGRVPHKLTAMYESSEGKRERRQYGEGEDIRRFLRWFSTFLSVQYQISGEVQCYYDISRKIIFVSTNDSRELRRIGRLPFPPYRHPSTPREKRHLKHWGNMAKLLFKEEEPYRSILQMLDEVIFQMVPDQVPSGTHAEQRILRYLESESEEIREGLLASGAVEDEDGRMKLKPEYLGGLRRACFACSYACHSDAGRARIHPGPLWPSKASLAVMETPDILRAIRGIAEAEPTFATFEDAKITLDHDTDSEDEDLDMNAFEEDDEEDSGTQGEPINKEFYIRVMRAIGLESEA